MKAIFCILFATSVILILGINSTYAQSTSNIPGTYDGKGIYKVEDMSVKIISNTNQGPQYRFIGSISNISNETMYLTGISIQMYDKNNKLIDFTSVNQPEPLHPQAKIVYKAFAPTADNEDFDHYVVSAVGGMNPSGYTTTPSNNTNPEDLYNECVGVAGQSLCDFLFKR